MDKKRWKVWRHNENDEGFALMPDADDLRIEFVHWEDRDSDECRVITIRVNKHGDVEVEHSRSVNGVTEEVIPPPTLPTRGSWPW